MVAGHFPGVVYIFVNYLLVLTMFLSEKELSYVKKH